MKKTTFIALTFFALQIGYAQQTISFENSEGFVVGSIHTQNGWVTTGCGAGCNILGQDINTAFSTDGSNSLKITIDDRFNPTDAPVVGAFYDFATPLDYSDTTISFDIYITNHVINLGSDFRFGVTGEDGQGDLFFAFLIDFNYQKNIRVINIVTDQFVTIGSWSNDTWYNVRIETTGSSIKYFIDNVEAFENNVLELDFTGLRIVNDNYGGDAYIDNLRINNEALSVDNKILDTVSISPNPTADFLQISLANGIELEKVIMTDLLGKTFEMKVINNTLNISNLANGIYLLSFDTAYGGVTKKIIKN